MVSFLENKLRTAIAKGFKEKLLIGTISRQISSSVNEYGDPIETSVTYRTEGFVSNYSDVYRAQAGIPETDSKIVIILGNSEIEPVKDDVISFPNWPSFRVRKVKIDPAKASAVCQSFENGD